MNQPPLSRLYRHCASGLMLAALCACSSLRPTATPPPSFYSLDAAAAPGATQPVKPTPAPTGAPTLIINPPHAAAGFDSQRIIYTRAAQKLEYFAHSEWVDPPARMISSLVVGALEQSGVFRAVVSAPGSASGELRLETEVLLLQQEFASSPSQVRFALRAYLAEDGTRRVVATRDFEALVAAPSDDPYGGVRAANMAVQNVLEQLTAFCAQTVAGWQPSRRVGSR